ncbi:hypothetical protein DPMN_026920 [Dreissena polymorpha]|uniref:Uncharacterized protein n=1 Tax=Dreissena polymorpha TaxID=45954 RepID=A0A9D4LUA4_DREPO|nr:hypothetical protein DPMN_026920 [Dreissena polymorpha]
MARQRPTRIPTPHVDYGACIVEIDRIVIRYVQYRFEGAPGLVMGPCIIEIDRIVIRDVQYQFEVNRCRNEEVIVKGNFGRAWSMWAPQVEIDRIVIRNVQYQFEVNQCRNEVVVKGNFGWRLVMGSCIVESDRIVIRDFQGSSANSVGGDSGQDGRTDGGDNHNIPTLFKKRGDENEWPP